MGKPVGISNEVATVLAKVSGQRAGSIQTMVTRATKEHGYKWNVRGHRKGFKGSWMSFPIQRHTDQRLNKVSKAFGASKLALVRAAILTTLPTLEKAAEKKLAKKETCPNCQCGRLL